VWHCTASELVLSLNMNLKTLALNSPYKRCNNIRNGFTGDHICRINRCDRIELYKWACTSSKSHRRCLRRLRRAGESGDLFQTGQSQADRNVHVDAVLYLFSGRILVQDWTYSYISEADEDIIVLQTTMLLYSIGRWKLASQFGHNSESYCQDARMTQAEISDRSINHAIRVKVHHKTAWRLEVRHERPSPGGPL